MRVTPRVFRWNGRSVLATLVGIGVAAVLGSCGGDATGPDTGAITITTVTSGDEPDADGYSISVDGGAGRNVPATGSIVIDGLSAGAHNLAVSGVANNCALAQSADLNSVSVAAGGNASVALAVLCETPATAIHFTIATTGVNPDSDGYDLTLSANTRQVASNGSVFLNDVEPVAHTWALRGFEKNCPPADLHPAYGGEVIVQRGDTAEVTVQVTCYATGTLVVTAETTGQNLDPNGYRVLVDYEYDYDPDSVIVAPNGSVAFDGVAAIEHIVQIRGLAQQCSVTNGEALRRQTVEADDTTRVAFSVLCQPFGAVRFHIVTTGSDLDPDGYVLSFEGDRRVGVNDVVVVSNVGAGPRNWIMGDLASNCPAAAGSPYIAGTVNAVSGDTVDATITVQCNAAYGGARVTATTSGSAPDPDGYLVTVDTFPSQPLAPNGGTVSFGRLVPGPHRLVVQGLFQDCALRGATNPITFTVAAVGDTTQIALDVVCSPMPAALHVQFESDRTGVTQRFIVAPDGSDLRQLSPAGVREFDPLASPDGRWMAYIGGTTSPAKTFYVQPVDGAPIGLVSIAADDGFCSKLVDLALDASRVAGIGGAGSCSRGASVWTSTVSASGVTNLRGSCTLANARFSPDGSRVATTCFDYFHFSGDPLMVANADGSGTFTVDTAFTYRTTNVLYSDEMPSWSPDGRTIAFARVGDDITDQPVPNTVNVIDLQTRVRVQLASDATLPEFSPDGRVTFVETADANRDLMVVNADGTGLLNLTQGRVNVQSAVRWSPDGQTMAFAGIPAGGTVSHIFVMKVDGSGLLDVTPSAQATKPSWVDYP
jgi:Tol biopolymer transport system component